MLEDLGQLAVATAVQLMEQRGTSAGVEKELTATSDVDDDALLVVLVFDLRTVFVDETLRVAVAVVAEILLDAVAAVLGTKPLVPILLADAETCEVHASDKVRSASGWTEVQRFVERWRKSLSEEERQTRRTLLHSAYDLEHQNL